MHVTHRIVHVAALHQSVTIAQVFDNEYGAFIEIQTRLSEETSGTLGIYVTVFNVWLTQADSGIL